MYNRQDFAKACELYREWNSKINVISRKDIDSVYEHHILHSLAILDYLKTIGEPLEGVSFLDVGTGGGFPGIPLAMCLPQCRFVLCDSIGKKIRVAESIARELGLDNVTCINARAETVQETFDWVVSRAVTRLDNFYPWVRGKFTRGILYLKGGDVNEEISSLCGKIGLDPHKVGVWPISSSIKDEYFDEKFVIDIRK